MAKTKFYTVSEKENKVGRAPKFGEACIVVLIVIALLVYLILIRGITAQIVLSICLAISCAFALFLGYSWQRVEAMVMDGIRVGSLAMVINLMIGMLIASWCAAGVVPYLIDIGIKIIVPRLFLPMACLLCCILSVCTGSSWTTAGTVGIALFGIGTTMGIPGAMIVGPILTGAYFGDKLSPISESTNCAAAAAETELMQHVHSMLFVVIPSTILACVIYGVMGWKYGGAAMDTTALTELSVALHENFWLNPALLIPLLILGFCIFKKMSSIPALGIAIAAGVAFAMLQGFDFKEICTAMYSGLKLETGTAIDKMLSKGGLSSMTGVITIIICGMPLGSVLRETKTLETIVYHFKGLISSPGNVVASSTITTTLLCYLTGNSYGAYILTSAAFGSAYDDWNIHRKVLSRVCEMAVVVQCLAPWTSGGAYMSNLFGISCGTYAPYYVWGYIVPIFTIICGYTGFGMFYNSATDRSGQHGWGKNKYVPDKAAFLKAASERTCSTVKE